MPDQQSDFPKDLYEVYQSGKLRRYNLLFAVNGGAFAILRFSVEQPRPNATALETLLRYLPWGMVIFSLVMFLDIWSFARMMRGQGELRKFVFMPVGMAILSIIGSLLVTGWLWLAFEKESSAGALPLFFIVAVILLPAIGEGIHRVMTYIGATTSTMP